MTYALAWPLQEALYALLTSDPGCVAFLGTRVHDAPPPFGDEAETEGLYAVLGDEEARDWSTASGAGAVHQVRIDIYAARHSFDEVKRAAGAVSDAVLSADFTLPRGRVICATFVDAKTRRAENDALRRIELRFRVTIEDTE